MNAPGCRATSRPSRGFTLLEMLLVLGLMTLMAGLFVVAANAWMSGSANSNTRAFQEALAAARARAVVADVPVLLSVEGDGRALILAAGSESRSFKLTGEAAVRFMQARFGGPGETTMVALPREVSKGVRFYPDGTCDAFVALFRSALGEDEVLSVDPWNCTVEPLAARDA